MKIKKYIYHIVFFDVFFCIILIILISLGFFLGFNLTKENLIIYFVMVLCVFALGIITFCSYILLCDTYFEFSNEEILLIKRKHVLKRVRYEKIVHAEYFKIHNLLLGDSKGGYLIIRFNENNKQEQMAISFSLKLLKRIPISYIVVKNTEL